MENLKPILALLAEGRDLSTSEASRAFETILQGEASDGQIGAFLTAIRLKGETVEEIAAGAAVMRRNAIAVKAPVHTLDTCGTGGDASGSYNISTAAALVVAACGVHVAKHGNRALSSQSGSSDVLQKLGVQIDLTPPPLAPALRKLALVLCLHPPIIRPCAMWGRCVPSLAFAPYLTCLAPCLTRPM